ncbi:hypothetical protein HGP17_12440 [Rhizobium sp. P38BS-XIX]|uniref:heparin lyase I family protein n=1 Tax=Rhizobium sp. P38BS-XIX TaxID=2726740 RepID=UPI0014572B76|nr:heparin lyase I family protein [Rhizobium sp. P38BS-XIX]NLR97619.1 hypothetical protein [Rhizobium sp. P38BS-XIX]
MSRSILCVWLVLAAGGVSAKDLYDTFDSKALDASKWTTQEIFPKQFDFITPGRCGAAAIEITTRDGDNGIKCEDDCQRAELRTAKASWPSFGDEVWYSFSFRINGDVPATGSARSVIGQWKGPGDQSPMIAQRFDNGVFHITVQDNEIRRVIAKAEGDPDLLVAAQDSLAKLDPRDERTVSAVKSLQSLDLLAKNQPDLTHKFFREGLLQTLRPDDNPAESKELSKSLGLKDSSLVSQFSALSFVAEPEKYIGSANIAILPEANRQLPDPRKGWVDMVYRVKPGRTDNEYGPKTPGEIDIWANGEKIVSVRGNLGATLKKDTPLPLDGPYFKFGIYRLRIPGTFGFQFDEFSQASSRTGLAPLCAAH